MSDIKLDWQLTEDEYNRIMAMALKIGATHVYAFTDKNNWFVDNGNPDVSIYEKYEAGEWFHYQSVNLNPTKFVWDSANDDLTAAVIALPDLRKYVGYDRNDSIGNNRDLKDALFVILKAGYTVIPPRTKE